MGGGIHRISSTHQIKKYNLVPAPKRRRDILPHCLIATQTMGKDNRIIVSAICLDRKSGYRIGCKHKSRDPFLGYPNYSIQNLRFR